MLRAARARTLHAATSIRYIQNRLCVRVFAREREQRPGTRGVHTRGEIIASLRVCRTSTHANVQCNSFLHSRPAKGPKRTNDLLTETV